MLASFANCWRIPELRARIVATIGLIFIARIGANIPLPGVDPKDILAYYQSMSDQASSGVVAMYNMFTGGALLKGAVFSLGIMPYISASIILQLMTAVVPSLARLQQEGEIGRQKIAQYARYLTILIALIQSALLLGAFCNPQSVGQALGLGSDFRGVIVVMENQTLFVILGVLLLTAGSVVMLWLGEQITQRGIGNGTSILITIGILADIPGAVRSFVAIAFGGAVGSGADANGPEKAIGMVLLFLIVTAAMVALNQAVRKVPVQYAQRMVGRKMYGGQSTYLPLKVNYAGVMPVIFAGAIMSFPPMLFRFLASNFTQVGFLGAWADQLQSQTFTHYALLSLLIFGFSYFWISIMFRPVQIADDLKKNNGYIVGVRPGEPTAQFLDFVMTRLTLAGSLFLLIIALLPDIFMFQLGFPARLATFLGGTGGLITVGVVLDTMRQVETYLLQSHYDGFLRKGRVGGVATPIPQRRESAAEAASGLGSAGTACVVLFVLGLLAWVYLHASALGL